MKTKTCITFLLSAILTGCAGRVPINLTVETPCPHTPNCVSTLSDNNKQKIDPFLLKNTKKSWGKLVNFIEKQPRVNILFHDNQSFHAEFKTKWLRFIDDVIMKRTGAYVDIRSASHLGYSDFGVNRKRIEELRKQLKTQKIIK